MKRLNYIILTGCFFVYNLIVAQSTVVTVLPNTDVLLSAEVDTASDYVWFRNGLAIPNETHEEYIATAEGFYAVIAFNSQGCPSEISEEVEVRYRIPAPLIKAKLNFCFEEPQKPKNIPKIGENIRWYLSSELDTQILEDEFLSAGYYFVTQEINGVESEPTVVFINYVNCRDLLLLKESVNNHEASVSSVIQFKTHLTNLVEEEIKNITVEAALPSGFRYVSHTTNFGSYDSQSERWEIPSLTPFQEKSLVINAEVLTEGAYTKESKITNSSPLDYVIHNNNDMVTVNLSCLKVYNEFTPNGDGLNDFFKIDCIENYPENHLKIYNRWGQLVYEQKKYENNWQGKANRTSVVILNGEKLPPGTYYFTLKLNNETDIKNWLYIAY